MLLLLLNPAFLYRKRESPFWNIYKLLLHNSSVFMAPCLSEHVEHKKGRNLKYVQYLGLTNNHWLEIKMMYSELLRPAESAHWGPGVSAEATLQRLSEVKKETTNCSRRQNMVWLLKDKCCNNLPCWKSSAVKDSITYLYTSADS